MTLRTKNIFSFSLKYSIILIDVPKEKRKWNLNFIHFFIYFLFDLQYT